MRFVVLLAAVFLAACSSSSPSNGSTCTPGATTACACPGGALGAQACNADGSSFGACVCPDGGTSDTGSGTDSGVDAPTDAPIDVASEADADPIAQQKAWCLGGAPRLVWAEGSSACTDETIGAVCEFVPMGVAGLRCAPHPFLLAVGFTDASCSTSTLPFFTSATSYTSVASVQLPGGYNYAAFRTSVATTPTGGAWYALDGAACVKQTSDFPFSVGTGSVEADSVINPTSLCAAGAPGCT